MIYYFARALCRVFFAVIYRWKIIGLENIPKDGAVILCSNHINNLDPPLVGSPIERRVYFMAKEELFKNGLLRALLTQVGAFPIKRGEVDRNALVTTLKILKEGKILGIFPEGTRSKTGELGTAHPGAALFAVKTGAAVIPTAVIGPYRPFRPITVVYGKPLFFKIEGKVDNEQTRQIMETIMSHIQQLMNQHR